MTKMNFLQKVLIIWQNVSVVQRALLIAVGLTLVAVVAMLFHWAAIPDMRMLYQDLAPEEASKITEKISEKDIPYELRNGGTDVYVPKEQVYQLRLDMAKNGLPIGSEGGYKIFDNEKIGISPFVQSVNLKRALQEELAKSIKIIDGVVHARVHIVNSEKRLFASQQDNSTASIVLKLKPGYRLSASNIAAITHLISGSVEGLKAEKVTVIDSQGRLLSGESDQSVASGAGTVADYKERVELSLARKVEDMLASVLGPGRATVKVSADIDMTSINMVTETYDPSKKVATKEEIQSNSEIKNGNASTDGKSPASGGSKKNETIVTEYVVGKTVEQKVELPGEIKSLSVAAFVDLSSADANGATAENKTPMIMQLADVEEIIRNALGLKETDSLKVVHTKFHKPLALLIDEKQSDWPKYTAIARQASLGLMAICAFGALRIFSGAKKKTDTNETEQLAGSTAANGLLPATVNNSEPLVLRKQIANALQNNPDQVKQLFSSWIEEGR
ncbi:MAG: flagellar M-ring protein FliF [Planctomycetes bacterium]|nr:flagellar M-ring protein FliF [Planctomycetota bacterium]